MATKLQKISERNCLRYVEKAVEAVVGKHKQAIVDEGQYRELVVNPAWKMLPLPVRLVGRANLRWDDFFQALRKEVFIRVAEGESERPEACSQVGVCTISNLPPRVPVGWPVQVSYTYEANGRLQVTVQLKGHEGVTTVFQRENSLADDELALWSQYVVDGAAL